MSATTWGWLVLAFPLAGSILCALLYRLPGRQPLVGWLGSAAIGLSFASGIGMFLQLMDRAPEERHLMLLLIADPPVPYSQISRELGIPVGSIGPTRARCLDKLRSTSGLERLLVSEGRRR